MEIYLFFDYDGHQNNLGCLESNCLDVLDEMLDTVPMSEVFGGSKISDKK